FELMMQYTILPSVAVFYNQYYCEFFCGCTNLRYIETKTFWLIFHQCIEHGLHLLFLKLRERLLCRHYRMDFLYNSRIVSCRTCPLLCESHHWYTDCQAPNGRLNAWLVVAYGKRVEKL